MLVYNEDVPKRVYLPIGFVTIDKSTPQEILKLAQNKGLDITDDNEGQLPTVPAKPAKPLKSITNGEENPI